jgi:hypothetical protein
MIMEQTNYQVKNNGGVLLITGIFGEEELTEVSELTKQILGIERPTFQIYADSIVSGSRDSVQAYLNTIKERKNS